MIDTRCRYRHLFLAIISLTTRGKTPFFSRTGTSTEIPVLLKNGVFPRVKKATMFLPKRQLV